MPVRGTNTNARNLEWSRGGQDGFPASRQTDGDEEAAAVSETMTRVGRPLSLATFPTLDGRDLDLQTLRGTKVLLVMWGSW